MASLADLLKHIKETGETLSKGYPRARGFADALVSNISKNVPSQADFQSPQAMSQWSQAAALNAPMGLTLKNLNAGLIQKYLQEGKLSPEEMAQYEKNALAMETPNLQKYNVQNAEAQIPDSIKRAKSLGFLTQPSKEQYHLTRYNKWGSNIPNLELSDLGFHTGTLEQAQNRGKALSLRELPFNEQSIIPITPNKYTNFLRLKDTGSFHADAIAPQLEKKGYLAKGKAKQIQEHVSGDWRKNEFYDPLVRRSLQQKDIDAVKYANEQEGVGDSYAYINPSVIRSRFAAFDPLRAASPSLLASTAGAFTLADLLNQDRNR